MPRVCVDLDDESAKVISKRAKRNHFTLEEQIEDILRKSAVRTKLNKTRRPLKVDDALVGIFSRQRSGRKKKKKK